MSGNENKRQMAKFLSMQMINESIQRYEAKIPNLDDKEMRKLYDSLKLSLIEVAYYQRVKNVALLNKKIDLNLANFIYHELNHWMLETEYNHRALAIRTVLTQVFMWMKLNKC
jgi:hypothetical protein